MADMLHAAPRSAVEALQSDELGLLVKLLVEMDVSRFMTGAQNGCRLHHSTGMLSTTDMRAIPCSELTLHHVSEESSTCP